MIKKDLQTIEKLSEGNGLLEKFYKIKISGVSTDTREIVDGNLFVPLVGENFDGHKFLDKAIENGAVACLWQKDIPLPDIDFPFILVNDTLKGIQTLAKNYRNSLKDIKIIGITGSNGKTSTKDIMDGILSTKYKTQKTMGNLNNHIGVPLTLLSLDEDTEVGIVEMGTDGFGQIEVITNLAHPDMALITNIGASHLDLLETVENVARAKFEILDGLKKDGLFIYNNDDKTIEKVIKEYNIKQRILNFGQKDSSDFKVELLEEGMDGIKFSIKENNELHKLHIPMIGRHNIYNAAVCIIVARELGISYEDIQKGLYNINATQMRNEIIERENFTILNDAYKSNPDSLLAALDTLYSIDGYKHKAVVLGDMLDLGEDIVKLHREVGSKIDSTKVEKIFTIGELGKHIGEAAKSNFKEKNIYHSETKEDLEASILQNIEKDTLILIKASRAVALEDVIKKLIK
ncbi:UDP-N-acetylmuramoyl-tripeptide--D-alanyl-D-alanine ligase [Tissierella creatinophila]|uniref:UDP-N-acetylmuramoyl-tripeptide--D-alanyl-D-alanine ligase n=1 Tax=Tissierella creatinophila DSM 6911 TaxID=1123403 RepID=A0A1U7M9C7_TISCR|nr:UDP-N-acetylmuramoyl-tripeptide--D-alanyl-D-alanine ligase [Tissierella creatinophila]OLS03808.1 UDP-N-acetylmuramoyl-tripeptide--D-alanyl-D-alanine ligase [Tissierella creatinophila DSM 6911]